MGGRRKPKLCDTCIQGDTRRIVEFDDFGPVEVCDSCQDRVTRLLVGKGKPLRKSNTRLLLDPLMSSILGSTVDSFYRRLLVTAILRPERFRNTLLADPRPTPKRYTDAQKTQIIDTYLRYASALHYAPVKKTAEDLKLDRTRVEAVVKYWRDNGGIKAKDPDADDR